MGLLILVLLSLMLTQSHGTHIVVSFPDTANGDPANVFKAFPYPLENQTTAVFTLGDSSLSTEIVFPTKEIGVAVLKDGSLGIFLLHGDGSVKVLKESFVVAGCYASRVVTKGDGDVFVLDSDVKGGVYLLQFKDNEPVDKGMVTPAESPADLIFTKSGQALLVGFGGEVLLYDWTTLPPKFIESTSAFNDNLAIVSDACLTPDSQLLIVLDDNQFSGVATRVAAVSVDLDHNTVQSLQVVTPVVDPGAVICSPFSNAALVASVEGNALLLFAVNSTNTKQPLIPRGAVTPNGAKPQLPDLIQFVEEEKGIALVAELSGLRKYQFHKDGSVTDQGLFDFGSGVDSIVGSMGIRK